MAYYKATVEIKTVAHPHLDKVMVTIDLPPGVVWAENREAAKVVATEYVRDNIIKKSLFRDAHTEVDASVYLDSV